MRAPMSLTPSAAEMRFAGQILYSFPLTLDFLIPTFNQQIYVSLWLGSGDFINVYINEIYPTLLFPHSYVFQLQITQISADTFARRVGSIKKVITSQEKPLWS